MGDVADEGEGWTLERELAAGRTWLVRDASGRRLVHKRLPDDCLRGGQLHPSIKLRLTRLRELPLGCFANLIGVERDDAHGVVLVSEYVDGRPLDAIPPLERARLTREVRLAVESMHQLGMIHGAIHARNAIVDHAGKLWLIDPSPLLHDDPAADHRAVDQLQASTPAEPGSVPSRTQTGRDPDAVSRQRTLLAAVAIIVLAIGAAVSVVALVAE